MSAPGGPGAQPPGGAHTCISVFPTKFAGSPLGESGVPAVRYGDFCVGGWQDPYPFGALCTAFGAGHDLYEITSESRFGVAPFGRTWVPNAASTQTRPANDTSSKSTGTWTSAVLLFTYPLLSAPPGRPRQDGKAGRKLRWHERTYSVANAEVNGGGGVLIESAGVLGGDLRRVRRLPSGGRLRAPDRLAGAAQAWRARQGSRQPAGACLSHRCLRTCVLAGFRVARHRHRRVGRPGRA